MINHRVGYMPDDLIQRLRDAATQTCNVPGVQQFFSPEQIARGLEAMRRANGCGCCVFVKGVPNPLAPDCDECWSSMLDAFIQGVREP